jgi:hypothetical protein
MRTFVTLLLFASLLSLSSLARAQERWTAPAEADSLGNPFWMDDAEVAAQGEELYLTWCSTCHGEQGDFTSVEVQKQSDGALFWKLSNGNPPNMLAYDKVLSEEERWRLVTYLRHLAKDDE